MKATLATVAAVLLGNLLGPPRRPGGVDFTLDVLPVLQRQGCASAYCHGSATGRAGFKLSLFGGDAAADYDTLTRQLGGRRIDLLQPERSLVLQKAMGKLHHGGGQRLRREDAAYERLRGWIEAGAPWRTGAPLQVASLRVEVLDGNAVVTASLSAPGGDASRAFVRDVTDLALLSSTDPTVVDVSATGVVTRIGAGEAHVVARYGSATATTRIVRPFAAVAGGSAVAVAAPMHAFDRAWLDSLRELGLAPAAVVSRGQLARRLHLDLVGRPPTTSELDAFVRDGDVAATVDRLLARTEFAEVWGSVLAQWLEVGDRSAPLVDCIARGASFEAIAGDVLTGKLGALPRLVDARDRAEYVGRTLLGMRIGCARCHDHPGDRWRQQEHLAFSACFASPRPDGEGGMQAGALFDSDTGAVVPPRLLALGKPSASALATTDALRMAEFVARRDHDALAQNIGNRLFARVFGRGFVEPVDDHRNGNPARAPGMLAALVEQYHQTGGRLAPLLRFLLTSRAYATAIGDEGPAVTYFAARRVRPLTTGEYRRALTAVVGRPPTVALPTVALPTVALPTEPLARELALQNGPFVRELLAAGGTTIDATFELCQTADERLHELWCAVLSRPPSEAERLRFAPYAHDLAACRDLAYALLTGREFGQYR